MPVTVIVIEDDEDVAKSLMMEVHYESGVSRQYLEKLVCGISSLPLARNSYVMRISTEGKVLLECRRGRKVKD